MKKASLALLVLGLIFSQFILFEFNLNQGFEFHGINIKIVPLADYAGRYSPESKLSSTFVGYLFFVVFGVLNTNKIKSPEVFKSAFMFTGISLIISFFEVTSIIEDMQGNYQGKYFHIGWLVFLLGLWIFAKKYLRKK